MNLHPYFPSIASQSEQTFHPYKDCILNHMNSPIKAHLKILFVVLIFKNGKLTESVLLTNLKAKTVF